MKSLVVFCVLAFVTVSFGKSPQYLGCIYIMGRCERECEVGTHTYVADCVPMTPEPTCDEPHPQEEQGAICDYSDCYCDEPTVRDTASGKCVALKDCPKKQ